MTNVESCAKLLETWATLRSDYLSPAGKAVRTANDIEALPHMEQLVWAQVEAFKQAAKVLRDPSSTLAIPTWLEDQWEEAVRDFNAD